MPEHAAYETPQGRHQKYKIQMNMTNEKNSLI